MPVSGDGILEATFDPAWGAVRLIVDGGMWPSSVDTITITRSVAGEADIPVRGVESRVVVAGTFVGSDHEAPLESSVTYRVDGYLATVFVASATVTVSTSGAEWGVWLKAPGMPDLTVLAALSGVGKRKSGTQGGIYRIAGDGGAISQSVANWSGTTPDSVTITIEALLADEVARIDALLRHRVLLIQTGAPAPIPAGYYYVDSVDITLISPLVSPARQYELELVRTAMPAGAGSGIAGTTWAALMDTYSTWASLMTAKATWFDVLKGF